MIEEDARVCERRLQEDGAAQKIGSGMSLYGA
jgi:hypothetical protein